MLCVARDLFMRAMHGSMDGGVFCMRLFRRLCCIAVVFMLFFNIAIATEPVDTEPADPPPASTQPPETEAIDDPGEPDDPVETEDPGDPEEPVDPEEPDDTTQPDDDEDDLDEEDEEDEEPEDIYTLLDVYKVTLPTTGSLDFVLDPLGLSGLAEGESATLDELDSGRIYPKSENPAIIINESSMPVKLTVGLRAVSKAGSISNDRVRFVHPIANLARTRSAVFDGDGLNILLYAVPSKFGVRTVHDSYYPSDLGFVITETGVEMMFLLPSAEYTYSEEYDHFNLIHGTGKGIQLRIGGYVNDSSDWSGYAGDYYGSAVGSIGLTAVFSLTRLYDDEFEGSTLPVDRVMFLRMASGHGLPIGAIVLDEESVNALTPQKPDKRSHQQHQYTPPSRRRGDLIS